MKTIRLFGTAVVISLFCLAPIHVVAQTPAQVVAKVVWVKGELKAVTPTNEVRILNKASVIYLHDTLMTETNSQAQIVYSDNSLMVFAPNTKLFIDKYEFNPKSKKKSVGKSVMKLVQGGFRAITGLIGKANPDDYTVNTPVATIGVRGTDYMVAWALSALAVGTFTLVTDDDEPVDTGKSPTSTTSDAGTSTTSTTSGTGTGTTSTTGTNTAETNTTASGGTTDVADNREARSGLYLSVTKGSISVANGAGEKVINAGEFGYVRDATTLPMRVDSMPDALKPLFNLNNYKVTSVGYRDMAGMTTYTETDYSYQYSKAPVVRKSAGGSGDFCIKANASIW